MQVTSPKTAAACELEEAGERRDGHEVRIVQLETWHPVSAWGDRGLAQACQLTTIDVGFEGVLLDGEVAIVDAVDGMNPLEEGRSGD